TSDIQLNAPIFNNNIGSNSNSMATTPTHEYSESTYSTASSLNSTSDICKTSAVSKEFNEVEAMTWIKTNKVIKTFKHILKILDLRNCIEEARKFMHFYT
ncbi:10842_t:CDS:2, partial [Scutellospora calospora]